MSAALQVETIEQRLARLLPGAVVSRRTEAKPGQKFQVTRPASKPGKTVQVLGFGDSEREAIDRALFLYGVQR